MMFGATVITLFPDMFPGVLGQALAGTALQNNIWSLQTINPRDFATDKHGTVDDTPYGGGAGMVMKPDIIAAAVRQAKAVNPGVPILYMSPRGTPLTQARVEELSKGAGIIILCGRYEGIDQRVIDAEHLEEVSIGDYVLAGGEVAAMVVLEAVTRLLPGVLGNNATHDEESFSNNLLEYPHYTRPAVWEGHAVPEVLTSGNHADIAAWRRAQAKALTRQRRPDLLRGEKKS
ncbi:MAG: tRNA (guanosine(37)-N1)-methyltransferase TrmD [Bdellovibrionales bacterium]